MDRLVRRSKEILGPDIQVVVADPVQPEIMLMYALPPKTWQDSESFAQIELPKLFSKQDAKVTHKHSVAHVPYYAVSKVRLLWPAMLRILRTHSFL